MSTFLNKSVWITGASSGIGQALALVFAREGARLILSSRNEEALQLVKEQCDELSKDPSSSLVLPLDISEEALLSDKVTLAYDFGKGIDLLINNAGISQRSGCLTTEMSTYRTIFEVDVFGQIALTKLVLPIMIEQGQGHIAVTSSVAGKIGAPFRTGYCAAKHAVMGFFDALRTEVQQHNIHVTTITPGYIRTNISSNAVAGDGSTFGKDDTDIKNGMSAHECAKVILTGLKKATPEIAVGSGPEMHALWVKRFFPNLLFKIMNKQYQKSAKRDGFS